MTYEILAAVDALLTDYSSVYWDYLNANRPIGLCWEDYDEFEKLNGFLINTNIIRNASEIVCTMEDFSRFLCDLHNGKDPHREERQKLNEFVNVSKGNASNNVVDAVRAFLKEG